MNNQPEEDPKRVFLKNLNMLNIKMVKSGFTFKELHATVRNSLDENNRLRDRSNTQQQNFVQRRNNPGNSFYLILIFVGLFIFTPVLASLIEFLLTIKCFFPNHYLINEAARPMADCNYCRNLKKPIIISNITYEDLHKTSFTNSEAPFHYSSKPIILKGAVKNWTASNVLNYTFIKDLYLRTPGALEEGCQFLNFRSNCLPNLRDFFKMSQSRIDNKEDSWYVGFSNCHSGILKELRKLYPSPPDFLPTDAEMPDYDWLFMGYDQEAIMHLDHNSRFMWQAQIEGNRTFIISPTPECDYECSSFSFYLEAGDAILLDTRVWYHGTYIAKGEISISIQSEYG